MGCRTKRDLGHKYRFNVYGALACFLLCLGNSPVALARGLTNQELMAYWQQLYPEQTRPVQPIYAKEQLAKAAPDECFYAIGDERNQWLATECSAPGTWKVSESVVWGMTQSGDKLWFGTLSNARCLNGGDPFYETTPHINEYWVCEFGESKISPPLPASYGDWRPPAIYVYRVNNRQLERKMYLIPQSLNGLPLISGIRGGGSLEGIVFLAGASGIPKTQAMGITLLAFNSETEEFLGWHELKDPNGEPYFNIRRWKSHNGHLYTVVWKEGGGRILRWLGDPQAIKNGDLTSLWRFEEVGAVDLQPSNIAVYQGNRLVVGTWPVSKSNQPAEMYTVGGSLWMSPPFEDHLTASDKDKWVRIWSLAEYEPNFSSLLSVGIGDLVEYDGYLWWGTMQQPGRGWKEHKEFYSRFIPGYPNQEQDAAAFYGTWRPTSVFRGRNLGTGEQQVELLYGFEQLPVFVPDKKAPFWKLEKNKMCQKPLWGAGGFGNFYLVYTYSMGVDLGRLLIGTNEISLRYGIMDTPFPVPVPSTPSLWGAELWRIDGAQSPAVAETLDGFGNYTSNTIKNIIVDQAAVFLSVGNASNLLTDVNDSYPEGGWELWRLGGQ